MYLKAILIEVFCVVVGVIMQQVEEQEKRHCEDKNCSPAERNRAEIKMNIAHFFANSFPKIGTVLFVLYLVAFIITGGTV